MKKEESEFGSGLVVCLAKFSEHLHFEGRLQRIDAVERWIKNGLKNEITSKREYVESFKRCELPIYKSVDKAFSHLIEMWANGATDHLYDLRAPKAWGNNSIAKNIKKLKDLGLAMGHGFSERIWTTDDIVELRKLTEKICVAVDKKIGIVDGDWGRW